MCFYFLVSLTISWHWRSFINCVVILMEWFLKTISNYFFLRRCFKSKGKSGLFNSRSAFLYLYHLIVDDITSNLSGKNETNLLFISLYVSAFFSARLNMEFFSLENSFSTYTLLIFSFLDHYLSFFFNFHFWYFPRQCLFKNSDSSKSAWFTFCHCVSCLSLFHAPTTTFLNR